MNSRNVIRTVLSILLFATIAIAADEPNYQTGTLAKHFSSAHNSYDLKDGDKGYQISNCGDFEDGQVVDYRVKEDKMYIHRDDGKDYKCTIEAKFTVDATVPSAPANQGSIYHKGTIEGYEIRRDTHVGGGMNGAPVGTSTRHARVYELHGEDLIYKFDFCGVSQAAKFSPGQVVEYRVQGNRLYIRHENDKDYSCQLEGTRKPDTAEAASQPAASSASATAAASTAKLSITSSPSGADIEVDGNFSGNTPSDLEVPEGEHTITVKKSGYQDWTRKMKVSAGSNIHLSAEMEKTTNP